MQKSVHPPGAVASHTAGRAPMITVAVAALLVLNAEALSTHDAGHIAPV